MHSSICRPALACRQMAQRRQADTRQHMLLTHTAVMQAATCLQADGAVQAADAVVWNLQEGCLRQVVRHPA